jgi:peptide deformylase
MPKSPSVVGVAIRKVTRLGHPVLRAPCRKLTPEEILSDDVQRLLEEMAVTMHEYEGVGIAANQVGEGISAFVMGLDEGSPRHEAGIPLTVVFNPEIKFLTEETLLDWEGCLSIPGLRGQVARAAKLELSGLDHRAKAFKAVLEGFPARVVQHETDHLNGKVYVDRMDGLKTLGYVD